MADKKKYMSYKDSTGAVTLTRKGSKYDDMSGDEFYDGMSGSASAEVIGKSKKLLKSNPNDTARVMRNVSAERRQKNAREGQQKDFKFFKHKTKGK